MGAPDRCCAILASGQHGCVALTQALECGLSREAVFRRARAGRWIRLHPGVYAVRGAPRTWEQRLAAASLWCGEGAAVAGASAAALWSFPGFPRSGVEIAHLGARRSAAGVVLHRAKLERCDVTRLDGHAVTTPGRTLIDVSKGLDATRFDVAFHHCLHTRITSLNALREVLARHQGRPGTRLLRAAVSAYCPGGRPAASPLEAKVASLIRRSRLPPPKLQHEVRIGDRRRFLDFAWPASKVALEADGYRWHSSRSSWESDRTRLQELRRAGWRVVHVTEGDLRGGFDGVVTEIATLLGE